MNYNGIMKLSYRKFVDCSKSNILKIIYDPFDMFISKEQKNSKLKILMFKQRR